MNRPLLFLSFVVLPAMADITPPVSLDPNLKIELIAAEPEINTPVGIAVDKRGRLFVVENNTHQVQAGYKGPKSDRIRIFEDTNGDGKPDKVTTFADHALATGEGQGTPPKPGGDPGFRNSMCLQFDPDGVLHLTKRDALIKLEDTDNDGACDKQTTLLRWETKGDYPHNGLSGMTFSPDGWLYAGSGENLAIPYTAIGADGKRLDYQPGGANIFRLRRDGSGLEIFATGLWNGFGVECDGAGRIFAVDNDPDSCPPNRLLHIVAGGDYGFNMTYGRTGLHPFQCWNGEIPGTLPMVCGVGEAAVGIIDLRRTAFRKAGLNLMVSSWGDNQIEAYKLVNKGASVTMAERTVLVRGDASFRPSCMAAAPDGSVYVCDWADREYSVHGKGRIWRISAKEPSKVNPGEVVLALSELESFIKAGDPESMGRLPNDMSDPFAFAAVVNMFYNNAIKGDAKAGELSKELQRIILKERPVPSTVGMMQMFRRMKWDYPDGALARLLAEEDPRVVRLAIIHAAERRLKALKPNIEAAVRKHSTDRDIFRTGIAALELIDKDASAKPGSSSDGLLLKIIGDSAQPPAIRALAILYLGDRNAASRTLLELMKEKDAVVASAAARAAGALTRQEVIAPLRDLAANKDAPLPARLDALAALSGKPDAELLPLLPLLSAAEPEMVRQAVRTLRGSVSQGDVRSTFEKTFAETKDTGAKSMLAIVLGKPPVELRPGTDEQWHEAMRTGAGNADEGRRVFFSSAALCSTCHTAEGRGTVVGPNLSTIARSADREKLIDSILTPSREIGPLYVMKTATLKDGRVLSGVQS
ncbi:MAG TPA: PVC-type heme-binding CxxCH protein, partial [Verrucomicrobiales bacterium]|nr:PVC-type heme-binding CxxCH protein [Verrucomicrobiales bacterium]